jgi:hypothetical protein
MKLPPGNYTAVLREVRTVPVRRDDGTVTHEATRVILDVRVHDDVCVLVDTTIAVTPVTRRSDQ